MMQLFSKTKYEYALLLDKFAKIMSKGWGFNAHIEGPKLGFILDGGFIIEVTEYDSCYFKHAIDGDIPLYKTEDDAQLAFCQMAEKEEPGHCAQCFIKMLEQGAMCVYRDHFKDDPVTIEVGWEDVHEGTAKEG